MERNKKTPLSVRNVEKTYRVNDKTSVRAVKGVSFEIQEGEIFGLLGPNGAGKTSTINMVTGLEEIDAGAIEVFGLDVVKQNQDVRKSIGVVHQELISHGFFNLDEILHFHSGYYGIWKNEKQIQFLLENLGLEPHRKKLVKQLSGGMKRRLMIAKALVHRPRLLLLDEPTAGVDVELRNSLWTFVKKLKADGVTILLTTHYLAEAQELCDRVAIINKGELKCEGPTQDVIRQFTKKRVEMQLQSKELASKLQGNSFFAQMSGDLRIEFAIPAEMSLAELMHQLQLNFSQIQDISTRQGTLEEAFLSVVSQADAAGANAAKNFVLKKESSANMTGAKT